MDCANCARSIETAVSRMDGVEQCSLNFTTETLRITGTADKSNVTAVVSDMGYTLIDPLAETQTDETAVKPPQNFLQYMWDRRETRLVLLAALLILPGVVLNEIMHRDLLWVDLLAVAALLLAGWPIARSGWNSLRLSREININVLMTIAAVGAVIIGATVEAAMVMVLFAIGESLEGYTTGRARQSIKSLMQIAPATATRLSNAGSGQATEEVPVQELDVGDLILIRPGERIPMDGRVLSGSSYVDQSPITGESRLVEKEPGDEIFAGSVNGHGALEVEVTHLAEDNTISRMIRLVEEAQEKRAPAQRFVDQFSRYYTPAVVLLAFLVATIPPLFFGQPFWNTAGETGWLYRGLVLLVVACPCALVISTPVSIISAISNAAKNGILIKGGIHLETLSKVHVMAFDKTGTLTEGKPSVIGVRTAVCETSTDSGWAVCSDCEDVLALAAAVESRSEHPLAQAVLHANRRYGCCERYPAAQNVSALTGRGVIGVVNGHQVIIGSHRWFDANIAHPPAQCDLAMIDEAQGYAPLMVSLDDAYQGTITVADTVRHSSSQVIAGLKDLGMRQIVMLTGDSRITAEKVGAQLGVTDVRYELLPQDKVDVVKELQAANGPVAMVGDGINDAPALATADVGIAVGGAGKPSQAMETADITLMDDDIIRLPFAVSLSQAMMRIIIFNLAFAIGIKVVFLLLVLAGRGTMWMAVLADMGASLLVTLNGMRLLNKKPNND
jgi:Cd2+/Zn2+-exporting ATPase